MKYEEWKPFWEIQDGISQFYMEELDQSGKKS
jgi:hypothetical protein